MLEIDHELRRLLIGKDPQQVKAETLSALKEFNAELKQFVA